MMFEVGKTYDFFYSSDEAHWNQRGEVTATDGVLVKVKDDHGIEEIINLAHAHFQSAKEFDLKKFKDFPDHLLSMPAPNT